MQQDNIIAQTENTRTNTRSQNQGIAESQQRMQMTTEKNMREWENHRLSMVQLVANIAQTRQQTTNLKANLGLTQAQTALTKEQTLSEPIKRALTTFDAILAQKGISRSDSGVQQIIKKVIATTEDAAVWGDKNSVNFTSTLKN